MNWVPTLVLVASFVQAACSFDPPADVGSDDAQPDAPAIDGSPADAPSCEAPATLCGNACVDLMTDPDHCGACGWNVVGDRSCVGGRPNPAWETISAAGAPLTPYRLAFWTGRRFLVAIDETDVYEFDPELNAWSPFADLPFSLTNEDYQRVLLPERETTFVWPAADGAGGRQPYLFVEGAPPSWQAVTTSGAPSARRYPGIARSDSRVYVMFGEADGSGLSDGGYYDLDAQNWNLIAGYSGGCDGLGWRANPIAIVNGTLMTAGGFTNTAQGCDGTPYYFDGAWHEATTALERRAMHRMLGVGGYLVILSGLPNSGDSAPAINQAAIATSGGNVTTQSLDSGVASVLGYAVRMGRSVFSFSGMTAYYGTVVDDAAIGQVSATGIAWSPVTSTGRPLPRSQVGGGSYSSGNQQETWTGRVAIIFGGRRQSGTSAGYPSEWVPGGATYQPAAVCVCPADVPECAGVTNIVGTCGP